MAIDRVAYWIDIADYDLDTAEPMYQNDTKQLQQWIKDKL